LLQILVAFQKLYPVSFQTQRTLSASGGSTDFIRILNLSAEGVPQLRIKNLKFKIIPVPWCLSGSNSRIVFPLFCRLKNSRKLPEKIENHSKILEIFRKFSKKLKIVPHF
jgi:hypothetical protein